MPYLGELSALITACLWSGSSLAFASATRHAGSFQVNITRLILALGYLSVSIILIRPDVNLSLNQFIMLGVSGVIGLTIGDTFLFKAYQEIGPRVAMLIMSLAPAIAAILAYFILGEGVSATGALGILITICGISLVVLGRKSNGTNSSSLTTLGIIYAFLAAAGQGGGLVFAKLAFRESPVDGFVATAVRIFASLIPLLPFGIATKRYSRPYQTFIGNKRLLSLTIIGSILGPYLGITFSLIAIEYTSVGIAATIMAIAPILMLPLVRIVYNERITWRAILGAIVAVAGVGVLFVR